jgi:pseudouridine synthase
MSVRLQKILSQWGIASRRQAEQMILDGRIQVNGEIVTIGSVADPSLDRITIDGKPITSGDRPPKTYILLNKPLGIVSTCADPQGRPTVLDLLPNSLGKNGGIHPVGRLDINSTGALILTNDGEFTFTLTHPRHHIPKTYEVLVKGLPPNHVLKAWREGIILDNQRTLPAKVRVLGSDGENTRLEIILVEGRNRQIRRVAEQLGYPVIKLHRVAIGPIQLHTPHSKLSLGEYRYLTTREIKKLMT